MITNTLHISFTPLLSIEEVPYFRGAVLKALSDDSDVLLHNHIDDKYRYDYPLVQYKSIDTKASIVLIGEGVDLLPKFMRICNLHLTINHRRIMLGVDKVSPRQDDICLCEPRRYRIEQWFPLNAENDSRYMMMKTKTERMELLEHILVGNILSMAKGLGIFFDGVLECEIQSLVLHHPIRYKGIMMKAFDAEFICNVNLPELIGIGKHASLGFGTIIRL